MVVKIEYQLSKSVCLIAGNCYSYMPSVAGCCATVTPCLEICCKLLFYEDCDFYMF